MIAVVTRCRNRLEYTIRVVNAVQRSEGDFTHIIIDNASSDGTKEWFKWMNKNTDALRRLQYYRYETNHGDWGGMLVAPVQNYDYVVQLDNDIIVPENWLTAMQTVLDKTAYDVIMLRRENVLWKLKPLSEPVNIDGWGVSRVERPVACFMMTKAFYEKCCSAIPPAKGMRSKYIIARLGKIGKIMNLTCQEIDSLTQRKLYNPKNPEVWEKI